MELPSMVQRSGDMLIVRSVVSGDQLYSNKFSDDESAAAGAASSAKTAKKQTPLAGDSLAPKYGPNEHLEYQTHRQPIVSPLMLEQQLEMYCAAAVAQKQHFLQQQQQQQHAAAASAVMDAVAHQQAIDLKEEGLPQCKIKRNYSCTYCTYFTQNPRYHLTHLRDVHGEKIFINKCKLCLYASRHFQKLVRHMKMVHGCTDGVTGANGQSRGKRGMSREVRKRKLEESVGLVGVGEPLETPTMEQVKTEMDLQNQKLQREIEAYKQHQTPDHQQLVQHATEAIYAVAANYERQLKEAKAMQTAGGGGAGLDLAGPRQASPLHSNGGRFRSSHSPSLTRHGSTPSPSGSGSPSRRSTPNALGFTDEAVASSGQNRLVKCSMCDFATVYPGQLVEHEQEEHRKTKFFRCEKCSYVTHIKARFSKHVKYHSMPMIKCVTCDFRTPYKWNLDRHMKNHGGAGPFKCAACDFTADIKQSLTVHEMNHHVPPVGHAAGMSLARRRNKVGGTDLCDDFLSDSAELEEDQYPHNNNNNLDDYDDSMMLGPDGYPAAEVYGKRFKYDGEEPTDLSQKGGSSDTSSVHNQSIGSASKAKRSIPDLIPFKGKGLSALNLSKDFPLRSGLTDIASMFLNEKALSEILQSSADKLEASQLSPTTTVASMPSSQVSRGLLATKKGPSSVGSGSIFDRMKFTAMSGGVTNENLVCPCGHMAKCLSESIIHRKTCKAAAMDDAMEDDDDEEPDDTDGRLEIDFANGDDDDRQSHSALNLSVTGSTRCQHCRHRCKSSADLLNHLKFCTEVGGRYGNDSPVSGESNTGRSGGGQHQAHDNRVSIWNKMPRNIANGHGNSERGMLHEGGQASGMTSGGHNSHGNGSSEENSYYGVETAPGYGEVTKKMTPEEEAANSSLKKVYKCPHCSFWASTASRFHVHIVGHLNKKPFECSLCSYRSNWRWDITKHIRLKTIRDPSHKNARVLMNDETGRRNYTKYNKYITLMKVTEEDGDPKLMKSGEMTPNQVASLSFINDFNKSALSPSTVSHLNGLKDDITLEPVLATKKPSSNGLGGYLDAGDQLADNLIHLPMFATMMNAAMAQQQHQQHQQNSREQEHATMITPSVTISAVKRSNSMPVKPSDDMIVEVKQEGNEKSTYYSCRKCSFRHSNRDAVLAHIKTHYADPNYPIVTATPTKVNSTYNKLLAAMCQQQNNNNNNTISNNNNNNKGLNLLASGGLLQQAIQGGERPFSGLALALAGKKSPAESAGAILEHGEQKASQNEASARSATSPSTTTTTATPSNQTHGVGAVAATTASSSSSPSLQHLLTSPRSGGVAGSFTNSSTLTNTNHNNSNTVTVSSVSSSTINNNNKHLSNKNAPDGQEPVLVAGKTSMGVQADLKRQQPPAKHHSSVASVGSSASVTTLSSSTSATAATLAGKHNMAFGDGSVGDGVGSSRINQNNSNNSNCNDIGGLRGDCIANNASPLVSPPPSSMTSSISRYGDINSSDGEFAGGGGAGVGGILYGGAFSPSNNNNHLSNSHNNAIYHNRSSSNRQKQHQLQYASTTTTKQTAASTSQRLGDSCFGNGGGGGIGVGHAMTESPHPGVGNSNKSNNNHNTHANLITTDGDRREPSPYRCGHCHQVSNWKHVIQRHCRLKHAGDIRIETLDRSTTSSKPIYKSLEQQLSVNTNPATMNNSNNNNNSTNKLDHLLNSPLANNAAIAAALSTIANAVANGGGNAQDIQAAAAYLAALNVGSSSGKFNMDDLMLHQQLQQNDQIEVTRLGAGAAGGTTSNLAQLLENNNNNQNNQNASLPQNSKSKQQKCPLCPHVSESKSQMNYHISLHKPTQYECSLCTFVCAKKQHLSSHMRTVHHQQPQQQQTNNSSAASLNMDFSMALQFAAAAKAQQQQQQQQQESASNQMVIDLTALKSSSSDSKASSDTLPVVSYCPKCPARFPHGRSDLLEHLKHHAAAHSSYRCKFCDFADDSDEAIQAHRYVHSQRYLDKLDDLKASTKEDTENRPPKLMQITAGQQKEAIWIVDSDLGVDGPLKSQQQNASISSSSASCASSSSLMAASKFDTANSLLKKQLEAGPVGATAKRQSSPAPGGESMATDETASEAGDSSNESVASHLEKHLDETSEEAAEKCMLCPYETKSTELYKEHLQHHASVSKSEKAFTCDHCDYADDEKAAIEEHTRVHFNAMQKLASIAFFTSYDKLELSIEEEEKEPKDEGEEEHGSEEASGQDVEEAAELQPVKIKLEHHNNNNEDDAVNENVLQELLKDASNVGVKKELAKSHEQEQEGDATPPPPSKPPTTKIILYKNDGCLSIKKDSPAAEKGGDSISDRLRRRRSAAAAAGHHEDAGANEHGDEANDGGDEEDEQTADEHQEQSHKILVNAKTGQVISKH